MKFIICLLLIATAIQVQARCNGYAGNDVVKQVFGDIDIREVHPQAYNQLGDVCMSGCYLPRDQKLVECNAKFALALKKYIPEIEEKLNKKADVAALDSLLGPKTADGAIPGCKFIGDYTRTVVNPCKLSSCGNIRQAVLCEAKAVCDPGSPVLEPTHILPSEVDFTCVADVEGVCPNMQGCFDDETYKQYEDAKREKTLAPQSTGVSKQ